MSAILTAADAALQLSSGALQRLGEAAPSQPNRSSSLFSRWPAMTAGMICLINTVHAVALGIIGNVALGAVLGVAAIGAGILTIYLWSFSTLQDLEGYVQTFAERVTALAQAALHLSESNEGLKQTRLTLEKQLAERTALAERQQREMEQRLQELDHIADELRQSQSQVVEMGKILEASHQVITEISGRIDHFVQLNHETSTTSQVLASELSAIRAIGDHFDTSVHDLGKQSQTLLVKKQQAEQMAHGLYTQFVQIAELFVGLKQQSETLQASLRALQSVDIGLATSTASLGQTADKLDRITDEAQTFLDWMKQFDGIAEYAEQQMAASSTKRSTS